MSADTPSSPQGNSMRDELPAQIVNALRDAGLGTAFASDLETVPGDTHERRWIWQRPGGALQISILPSSVQPKLTQAVLENLAGTGLAPELRVQMITPSGVVQVVTDPGRLHWSGAPEPVARTLGKLHRLQPPKGIRRIPGTAAALIADGLARIDSLDNADATVHRADLPDLPEDIGPEEPTFLHGDPCPATILMKGDKAVLTGWQGAGLGDPSYDLAAFLAPSVQFLRGRGPIAPHMRARFLHAYPLKRGVARMIRLQDAYHWYHIALCLEARDTGRHEHAATLTRAIDLERQARMAGRETSSQLSFETALPEDPPRDEHPSLPLD